MLEAYDYYLNILIVVIMPLLIWGNLRSGGMKSPMNQYLWTEHPNFMRCALVVLALLTAFSAVALLGHYGLLPASAVETLDLVIGVPFMIAAVAMIVLTVSVVLRFVKARKAS
jgi:hypothetical protein